MAGLENYRGGPSKTEGDSLNIATIQSANANATPGSSDPHPTYTGQGLEPGRCRPKDAAVQKMVQPNCIKLQV